MLVPALSRADTNYVALSGNGSDGSTWANAWTNLNDAVSDSADGDVILVKTGTYNQTAEVYIGGGTNLTVRGGYAGSGTPGPYTTDAEQTVLEADVNPSYFRVLHIDGAGGRIEGLTLAKGNAYSATGVGGGLYLDSATTLVTNCIIRDCLTQQWSPNGGGVAISGGSPTLADCVIRDNFCNWGGNGGGLSVENSTATIRSCLISGNTSRYDDGGGVYVNNSAALFDSCVVRANFLEDFSNQSEEGAGVYVTGAATCRFLNCLVIGNVAKTAARADGMSTRNGNALIENCTIANNLGLGVHGAAGTVITNSLLWNNGGRHQRLPGPVILLRGGPR